MKHQTIRSGIHYFRKLSFQKIFNIVKISLSYKISTYFKKTIVWGLPYSITIEPTTSCNLRCPECPSGLRNFSRPTGDIDYQKYCEMIEQIAPTTFNLFLYFQGEPFMHPQFLKLVSYAQRHKIYTTTSTNGHFISKAVAEKIVDSGIDRLIISIDGTTQKTYSSYRKGGDLNRVIQAVNYISTAKKEKNSNTPFIVIQFLVVKPNEHQIPEIKKLAKQLGANMLSLKSAQIYNFENGSDLIPQQKKYARYKQVENGKFILKNKLPNTCSRLWNSSVISWDGKMLPCCFDKDAQYPLGNSSKFKIYWKSEPYNDFRKKILYGRKNIDICTNCTEGLDLNDF